MLMKKTYLNEIHINNFKKYILNKENVKNSKKKKIPKRKGINLSLKKSKLNTLTPSLIDTGRTKINEDKIAINSIDENSIMNLGRLNFKKYAYSLYRKNKSIITQRKKRLINDYNNSANDILSSSPPKRNRFNVNSAINSTLYYMYKKKMYPKVLIKRINPYINKEKERLMNLKIDLRKKRNASTQINFGSGTVREMKHSRGDNDCKTKSLCTNRREIGVQSSFSCENLSKTFTRKKKEKELNIKIKGLNENNNYNNKPFNKYDLINKEILKGFKFFSKINKRYEKFKKLLNMQNTIYSKILDKLKIEQNMSEINLKLSLVKLEGYNAKKYKRLNNNSYNLFL